MPTRLVEQLSRLPGSLCTAYGMTELGLYVTFSKVGELVETLSTTIGHPHVAFELRVVNSDSRPADTGEMGELQARGDWVMAGYFRDAQATGEAFTEDGWFCTGDIVKVRGGRF